jgi:hypothetical protein
LLVKITVKQGYSDRFGVFHEFGSVADLPDAIADKMVRFRIGSYHRSSGPIAVLPDVVDEPPMFAEDEPDAVDESPALSVAQGPFQPRRGRPPKKV